MGECDMVIAYVTCQHCNHKWRYGGNNMWKVCCPRCHYVVRFSKHTELRTDEGHYISKQSSAEIIRKLQNAETR